MAHGTRDDLDALLVDQFQLGHPSLKSICSHKGSHIVGTVKVETPVGYKCQRTPQVFGVRPTVMDCTWFVFLQAVHQVGLLERFCNTRSINASAD